jgi:hypothetical protein
LPPGALLVAVLATDDFFAVCSVRRLMHPANSLRAAMPRLVVRRLGVRACTTLIADERDNVSGADIGIEGLRKSRHRHESEQPQ